MEEIERSNGSVREGEEERVEKGVQERDNYEWGPFVKERKKEKKRKKKKEKSRREEMRKRECERRE